MYVCMLSLKHEPYVCQPRENGFARYHSPIWAG